MTGVTGLLMWTVYDHPSDYPGVYVARKFVLDEPTGDTIVSHDLEALRAQMERMGLVCLTRDPDDDPAIIEVWL